jgi:hypothetical protein
VSPLENLSTIAPEEWRELYRAAVAAGCGRVICRDDERLAAPDELLALTLPELVRLGSLAMLTEGCPEPPCEYAKPASCEAAVVLRLLDGALAAHARDHDYSVAAWLDNVSIVAHATACDIARREVDALRLETLVLDAAAAMAGVVIALHRDRIGVPEKLLEALGSVLVLHVAALEVA